MQKSGQICRWFIRDGEGDGRGRTGRRYRTLPQRGAGQNRRRTTFLLEIHWLPINRTHSFALRSRPLIRLFSGLRRQGVRSRFLRRRKVPRSTEAFHKFLRAAARFGAPEHLLHFALQPTGADRVASLFLSHHKSHSTRQIICRSFPQKIICRSNQISLSSTKKSVSRRIAESDTQLTPRTAYQVIAEPPCPLLTIGSEHGDRA